MPALSLKPSSKGVTVLIIVAVVILFGCVLGYVGAAGKLKTASDELAKKEKLVEESKQIALKLEQSRLNYFEACSQVRYLESSVASRDYVPTLLKQMERLGQSVHLRVLGVRPEEKEKAPAERSVSSGAKAAEGNVESASKTTPAAGATGTAPAAAAAAKPYDEMKITVQAECSYMNALDFLSKLTTFPKIVAVDAMEMAPGSAFMGRGTPKLTLKMTITAFILKEPQPTTTAPSTGSKSARGPALEGGSAI